VITLVLGNCILFNVQPFLDEYRNVPYVGFVYSDSIKRFILIELLIYLTDIMCISILNHIELNIPI